MMNSNLVTILADLENKLADEQIHSFKIGVTHSIEERKMNYHGYYLIEIASGSKVLVLQAERDLINHFLASSIAQKCENTLNAAGTGQVNDVSIVYVAIKVKDVDKDNNVHYVPVHFNDYNVNLNN